MYIYIVTAVKVEHVMFQGKRQNWAWVIICFVFLELDVENAISHYKVSIPIEKATDPRGDVLLGKYLDGCKHNNTFLFKLSRFFGYRLINICMATALKLSQCVVVVVPTADPVLLLLLLLLCQQLQQLTQCVDGCCCCANSWPSVLLLLCQQLTQCVVVVFVLT